MECNKTKSVFDSNVKQIKTKLNVKRVRHGNGYGMLFGILETRNHYVQLKICTVLLVCTSILYIYMRAPFYLDSRYWPTRARARV